VRSGLDPSRLCTGRGAISGECTGLTSRALSAPCGKIHGQPIEELHKRGIQVDGANGRYLLQIFTQTLIGPIFFEIIEKIDGLGS